MVQDADYWVNRPEDDEQRDWGYGTRNWVSDYWASREHPHRDEILRILKEIPFNSLAEVGCNCGPNLQRIREEHPNVRLYGIDVSPEAVKMAHNVDAMIEVGDARSLPWAAIDVLLYDAVLMYLDPTEIGKALDEMQRVAQKAVIILDRYADSKEGTTEGHIWSRDYKTLIEERGFKVEEVPVTEALWPSSKGWQTNGRIYISRRQ